MAHVDSFIRDANHRAGACSGCDDAATAARSPMRPSDYDHVAMYSVTMHITGSQATSYEKNG